jgi:hypothetical protein
MWPGTVDHACNPSTWEKEARRFKLQVSLDYIARPYLKKKKKKKSKLCVFLFILLVSHFGLRTSVVDI